MRTVSLAIVSFAALVLSASVPHTDLAAREPSRTEEVAEGEIAQRINVLHAQYLPHVQRLLYDPELARIARARSRAFAQGALFSHQDEDGGQPTVEMVRERFGPYSTVGENIFVEERATRIIDPAAFAQHAVRNWMANPEHRDNILSPGFIATGIGVVVVRDRVYATQVFRGPTDSD